MERFTQSAVTPARLLAAWVVLSVGTGCGGGCQRPTTGDTPDGAVTADAGQVAGACSSERGAGCPCAAGEACAGTATCDNGYCTPTGCARGALGCGCFVDGTCGAVDGTALACLGNVCRSAVVPADGTVGAACLESPAPVAGSPVLECRDGELAVAGCPSGDLGCPCGAFGRCNTFQGRAARCFDGRCALGGCAPGSLGCGCRDGACDTGLACESTLCRGTHRVEVAINGSDLRACDVLLHEGALWVSSVTFAPEVLGEFVHRSPDVAVSLVAREDAALTGGAITLEMRDETNPAASQITVSRLHCYDRLGRPAAGVTAQIQQAQR
ncbi:MAG: hypothetical protein HY904_00735 [Deltaproteobacteria bacterium]|nr:hypothetical protein [Deltaproteobacteria bacterium]